MALIARKIKKAFGTVSNEKDLLPPNNKSVIRPPLR